jgi:hypothetical protein
VKGGGRIVLRDIRRKEREKENKNKTNRTKMDKPERKTKQKVN